MSCAERNRNLKKTLETAFGRGKVTVKGSKGTAYGWVTVNIAYAPKDTAERDALKSKVWELIRTAKIHIGTYGYDDPGSDYGYGSKMHLNFEQCRDVFNAGERVSYCGKSGTVKERDYRVGGDWYVVNLDNGAVESACYKGDLSRVAA
jgi:hypothetical protein